MEKKTPKYKKPLPKIGAVFSQVVGWLATPLAWGLIFAMAASDFYTVRSLFIDINVGATDAMVYAGISAIILEMLPSYMGLMLGKRRDKARYEKNLAGGFSIMTAFFVTVALIGLLAYLRYGWVSEQVELGNIGGRRGNEDLYKHMFLAVLPALTSIAAFLISWFMLRTKSLEDKYQEVCRLQEEFFAKQAIFRQAHDRCMEARTTVWTSVCDSGVEPMPEGMEAFRRECFTRIRAKLVDDCLVTYPTQIERYSMDVESKLQEYLLTISKHSTLPHTITSISLEELIRDHDDNARDPVDRWDYNESGPDLEAELRRTIDNAVVVAQYKSALNPYYLEKKG